MEGANKFDPKEIPNMISMLVGLHSDRRGPNGQENAAINNFYMRYMGKAMDDCQSKSSAHWQVARPQKDVALNFKTVEVQGESPELVTQFIVATTAAFCSNKDQYDEFRKNSQDAILDQFEDDDVYRTIFNKMALNVTDTQALLRNERTLCRGLWIACRLSAPHFMPAEDGSAD
jgi:hypothetical protein